MGWQWVTGSGIDSSPFFRVFNPLTQSEKFDNSAEYINEYVPEVHKLHQPLKKYEADLKELNISLHKTYPYPIVDHNVARKRTLDAFDSLKHKTKQLYLALYKLIKFLKYRNSFNSITDI